MRTVQRVTKEQLTQILLEKAIRQGMGSFAKIVMFTDAHCRKTNNPFRGVRKLTEMSCLLNTSYEKGVKNQRKKEGKDPEGYVPGENFMPLVFGENNNFIGFFEKTGKAALQMRPFEHSYPKVRYFTEEGIEVAYEDIKEFLPKRERDPQNNRQGTEKEIMWRKPYVENILELTFDHVHYVVIN